LRLPAGCISAIPYCIDLIEGPYLTTNEAIVKAFRAEAVRGVSSDFRFQIADCRLQIFISAICNHNTHFAYLHLQSAI